MINSVISPTVDPSLGCKSDVRSINSEAPPILPSTTPAEEQSSRQYVATTTDTTQFQKTLDQMEEAIDKEIEEHTKRVQLALGLTTKDDEGTKITRKIADITTQLVFSSKKAGDPILQILYAIKRAISTILSEEHLKGNQDFLNFENVLNDASFGSFVLGTSTMGSRFVSVMCKRFILEQLKKELTNSRAKLADPLISLTDKIDLEKDVKKREAEIDLMGRRLVEEEVRLGLGITSQGVSLAKSALGYIPKQGITKSVEIATTALKWIGTGFEIVIGGIETAVGMRESRKIRNWTQALKCLNIEWSNVWKKHSNKATSLKQVNEKLKKWNEKLKEKTESMLPKFDRIFGSISEENRARKIKEFDELINQILDGNHFDPKKAQRILLEMGIHDGANAEENAELIEAFARFKQMSDITGYGTSIQTAETLYMTPLRDELKNKMCNWANSKAKEAQFKYWIVRSHVQSSETIGTLASVGMSKLVEKKHSTESILHKFKLRSNQIKLVMTIATVVLTVALLSGGALTLPVAGVLTLALLVITTASPNISLLLSMAYHTISYYYKPHITKLVFDLFFIKMGWIKLRTAIQEYSEFSKRKKLIETGQAYVRISAGTDEEAKRKAEQNLNKAYDSHIKSEAKLEPWRKKLAIYETRLFEANWEDLMMNIQRDKGVYFVKRRQLEDAVKDVQTKLFQQAVSMGSFDDRTRRRLEVLGWNLDMLQKCIDMNDKSGFEREFIKPLNLSKSGHVAFIDQQQEYIKKGTWET